MTRIGTPNRGWLLIVAALLLTVGAAGCLTDTSDEEGPGTDGNGTSPGDDAPIGDERDVEALASTARQVAQGIESAEDARAAGFEPVSPCVPGQGVHWLNPDRIDTELDRDHPEILLFQPDDANLSDTEGDRLIGIEYVVVTEGTERNSSDTVPSLEGVPFDGPMPGHTPDEPWHAELHIWLGPNGTWEPLGEATEDPTHGLVHQHPKATCPAGTTPAEAPVLATAREVARGLDTAAKAEAAGYHPASVCVPGQGVHWVHHDRLDTTLNASAPEVLMFLPSADGVYDREGSTLIGIEHVVATEGTPRNESGNLPTLGPRTFDGPMPGHTPDEPWHAELHIWLGPDGSWHPWGETTEHPRFGQIHSHPKATCPNGTTTPPSTSANLTAATAAEDASGNLSLVEAPMLGTLQATVEVSGMDPGDHAVHIHENGDCDPTSTGSGPAGAAGAGGLFNPDGEAPANASGNLGNITVGDDGTGRLEVTRSPLTLEAGATYGVAERSLIVHANPHGGEDPTGDAGRRVLCGVIPAP